MCKNGQSVALSVADKEYTSKQLTFSLTFLTPQSTLTTISMTFTAGSISSTLSSTYQSAIFSQKRAGSHLRDAKTRKFRTQPLALTPVSDFSANSIKGWCIKRLDRSVHLMERPMLAAPILFSLPGAKYAYAAAKTMQDLAISSALSDNELVGLFGCCMTTAIG